MKFEFFKPDVSITELKHCASKSSIAPRTGDSPPLAENNNSDVISFELQDNNTSRKP